MRFKIDFDYGYISLDASEEERAWKLFKEENGIRISLCRDIFDEGTVLAGKPIVKNLDLPDKCHLN